MQRAGYRARKVQAYPNHWSQGKVHYEVWLPKPIGNWTIFCQRDRKNALMPGGVGGTVHGYDVSDDAKITCSKCEKLDELAKKSRSRKKVR